MIACYCRVSSVRQKTDSQKPEIRRWLQGNGIDPSTAELFEDKETGRTLGRPGFDRLQKAIFAGEVRTVEVWKRDRISRRQRDGVEPGWRAMAHPTPCPPPDLVAHAGSAG